MKQDLRFALRMLMRSPGFTLIAVSALALGIGANTAIFSVINAVLLRPLPYAEPDRLVMIWQHLAHSPVWGRLGGGAQDAVDYRRETRTMETVAAFAGRSANMTGLGNPERVTGLRVSANLFGMLGVAPFRGRSFLPEEDLPGRDREILLGYGFWQRRFGSDPKALGATVSLDGVPYTIVGIMPKSFFFPPPGFQDLPPAEFWTPIAFTAQQLAARGDSFGIDMIGRLKPGVGLAQATADVERIARNITETYPAQYRERLRTTASLENLQRQTTQRARVSLLVLLSAVAFVLLIACANVANLLLAKAAAREHEIRIRVAIGAARSRILRQVLTESVLLALIGGIAGSFLAAWTVGLLIHYSPGDIPRLADAHLDWRVLGFTLALSTFTGVLFGIAPALRASMANPGSRGPSLSLRRSKVRGALVVGEVAIALTLLVGAGLLLRSFVNLLGVPSGFNAGHLLTATITVPASRYPDAARIRAFYDGLMAKVQALPSVQSAALGTALPFSGDWTIAVTPEGEPTNIKSAFKTADLHGVTAGYHRTLGIRLERGRLFTNDDRADSLPVAVINETMARRYWPGQDALGKRFKWGVAESSRPWLQVIGIVGDTKHSSFDEDARAAVYLPYAQMGDSVTRSGRTVRLAIRTAADPLIAANELRHVVSSADPELPVYDVREMTAVLAEAVAPRRFNMLLLAAFAMLALLLAAVGIYGVMSYAVNQYTHEIGIRMALGARSSGVVRMVLRQGMTLALAGIGAGAAAALALTRLMKSLLFEIRPADPLTFVAVSILIAAIAFAATYIPARRATRIDPIEALRYE